MWTILLALKESYLGSMSFWLTIAHMLQMFGPDQPARSSGEVAYRPCPAAAGDAHRSRGWLSRGSRGFRKRGQVNGKQQKAKILRIFKAIYVTKILKNVEGTQN